MWCRAQQKSPAQSIQFVFVNPTKYVSVEGQMMNAELPSTDAALLHREAA